MATDKPELHTYVLYWSPEGRPIATVKAKTGWDARKMAPMPYRKFIGEIYSVRQDAHDGYTKVGDDE